jgi:uncharacterized repeat protein (TIGR02543 family)
MAVKKIKIVLATLFVGLILVTCSEDFLTNNPDTAPTYTLTTNASPTLGGGVARNPDRNRYEVGTTVTLTAEPNTNYKFTGWTGVPSGVNALSPEITLTINRDLAVIAYFEEILAHTVTYNGNGNTDGTAPVDINSPYTNRSTVIVLGHGDLERADHVFGGWNTEMDGNGTNYASDAMFSITENITLYARWIDHSRPIYSVTLSGAGIGASGSGSYTEGMNVEISAGTAEGQRFVGWTTRSDGVEFDDANSSRTSFIMPANEVTVTANFEVIPTYEVTVVSAGIGMSGGGSYMEGEAVWVSAGTVTGHRFISWTATGTGVVFADASAPTTSFTMPSSDVTVTAIFEEVPIESYLVTVVSPGIGISGAGNYLQGETVTINAGTPPPGQMFVGWTTTSNDVIFINPNSAITTFTMPTNAVTVTASFEEENILPPVARVLLALSRDGRLYLGRGYDVIRSSYIHRGDVRRQWPILDQERMIYDGILFSEAIPGEQRVQTFVGTSVEEFYTNRNEGIGLGLSANVRLKSVAFSGNFNAEFSMAQSDSRITRSSFLRGRSFRYTQDEYILRPSAERLADYLDDNFANDLHSMGAAQILDRYGSHIFIQYYRGGAMEFNYAYHGTQLTSSSELSSALSTSLTARSVFASGSASGNLQEQERNRQMALESSSTFNSLAYGGSAVNFSSLEHIENNYGVWLSSIENDADICGIGRFDDSFIPIWELVEASGNTQLARELENEFWNRAERQGILLASWVRETLPRTPRTVEIFNRNVAGTTNVPLPNDITFPATIEIYAVGGGGGGQGGHRRNAGMWSQPMLAGTGGAGGGGAATYGKFAITQPITFAVTVGGSGRAGSFEHRGALDRWWPGETGGNGDPSRVSWDGGAHTITANGGQGGGWNRSSAGDCNGDLCGVAGGSGGTAMDERVRPGIIAATDFGSVRGSPNNGNGTNGSVSSDVVSTGGSAGRIARETATINPFAGGLGGERRVGQTSSSRPAAVGAGGAGGYGTNAGGAGGTGNVIIRVTYDE